MNKKLFFFFALFFSVTLLKAQNIRTDVLVIGNGNAAWAAGLQSAKSGVKTTILLQGDDFNFSAMDKNIHSGIEADFMKKLKDAGTKPVAEILKLWADSNKNLSILHKVNFIKIERSGNNWTLKLDDGRTLRAQVLVHAAGEALTKALKVSKTIQSRPVTYTENLYRTSVASGNYLAGSTTNFYSLYDMIVSGQENLVFANGDGADMLVGQAAGATAAYAAFFKTKTSLSNLNVIQGELLNYKAALMPFADIPVTDPNWRAIQTIGLTGVVKAENREAAAYYMPDKVITITEIKQPIKGLYYKAQIWFDDHKDQPMSLENTLNLVCYVGNKSIESTRAELEKKWKTDYKFSSAFDLKRELSRREFAVIAQDYLQPFHVNVDKTGKVLR